MSEQLAKAMDELRAAILALDLAETKYLKFADFNNPAQQISWARHHKPAMQAAERRLDAACEALKAAGWVKPRAFLPKPGQDLAHDPASECPAHAHEETPQKPDQQSDQR